MVDLGNVPVTGWARKATHGPRRSAAVMRSVLPNRVSRCRYVVAALESPNAVAAASRIRRLSPTKGRKMIGSG